MLLNQFERQVLVEGNTTLAALISLRLAFLHLRRAIYRKLNKL